MLVLFAIVGLVLVVVVALVAVGGVVNRLQAEPPRNVFDNDEAVEFVAQALPDLLTAEVSYDDVQRIMRLHDDYLHAQGVSRSGGDLLMSAGPRVIDLERGVDYVLDRAARVGFFPRAEVVREVIGAQLAYFEAIGAVAEVEPPELEELEAQGLDAAPGADDGEGRRPDANGVAGT